jgi:Rad3-related DNA helicase
MTCEDGGHLKCPHQKGCGCAYNVAREAALASSLVITNYAYWIAIHQFGEGLGDFDLLILDEAHDCPDQVCSAMAVHLTSEEVYRLLDSDFPSQGTEHMPVWEEWAKIMLPRAEIKQQAAEEYVRARAGMVSIREAKYLAAVKTLVGKLTTIAHHSGAWVVESDPKSGFRFDPVWASEYAEKLLFRGVKKIVLVSATVLPKTMDLLGVPASDYDYFEYPAVFPPSRSPVIHVPTVSLTHRVSDNRGIMDLWLMRIDQLLRARQDRKGIIHTVSYHRAQEILAQSEFAEFMVSHKTADAMHQAKYYRDSHPPAYLLSPSMSTGYDFPYSSCEFQIICKVPYPDTRSAIMATRVAGDPLYSPYITSQSLVQSTGRGMRAEDDRCENLIIDDQIRRFLGQCFAIKKKTGYKLLPEWWLRLYRRCESGLPEPPPKLEKRG